jgi:hypothetical protein
MGAGRELDLPQRFGSRDHLSVTIKAGNAN